MKISDEIEEEIEEVMDSGKINELIAVHNKIGIAEDATDLMDEYVCLFRRIFEDNIEEHLRDDFIVGLDVANGATYKVAEEVFKKLGIKYKIINNNPDGININHDCGSTHLEGLKKFVLDNKLSLGIAYDGDGDRCLAIDEKGNLIDGDILLAIFAKYLQEKGKLNKDTLVATIMSNMGLNKFAEKNNLNLSQTKVGDRYVLEEMLKNGYNLGGEQSGHIILLDYNPTGDGILTSLMLIQILLEKNVLASELCDIIQIYPQVLINAKVNSEKKSQYLEDKEIQTKIKEIENEFANEGRVVIRPSGTEPLIRVMIEGKDKNYIAKKAEEIAKLIEEKLN
jgi:phosphoglucosamine mutase